MQNELTKILSFANENPACHLATDDNGQPRIRGMLMWYADETGFYFHTSSVKRLPGQLKQNPKVEVAFLKPSQEPGVIAAMRVTGKVEILNDDALEQRLLKERPWLQEYSKISPESKAVIFRIIQGEAYFWNMSNNMKEDEIEKVSF